ncbi:MAG: outer membrane protein [Hyphomicrobiales bacterium]|nr:outer membrane protein [Hyphomicrobiales bacterium]
MSKILFAALFASGMAVASVPAYAQTATTATKEDQTFLTKVIEGNLAEIEMGKLAQDKAQSQELKDFGTMLVKDHTDSNTKAMDLAKQINITAPTQPSKKQVQDHDRLAKLNGAQFDREFTLHMVSDHKEDIADFTKQSKMKAGDPTVSFASETLPVLQKHLQTAESLEKGAKK